MSKYFKILLKLTICFGHLSNTFFIYTIYLSDASVGKKYFGKVIIQQMLAFIVSNALCRSQREYTELILCLLSLK